jgi:hypothetical protein
MKSILKEAAQKYLQSGWQPIALYPQEKRPIGDDWQKQNLLPSDLEAAFSDGTRNIGILLGKPSGNLVDVDLDCSEAVDAAKTLLPPTEAISGRKSRSHSHYWYRVDAPVKTERIKDGGKTIIELRSDGAQTMVPPSTHPDGEQVEWMQQGTLFEIRAELLQTRVRLVAAAVILIRNYPAEGSRHDVSLCVAACLCRAGIDEECGRLFIETVCGLAGDEELAARVRNVADTYKRVSAEDSAWGLPKLSDLIGEKAAREFARHIGLRSQAVVPHHGPKAPSSAAIKKQLSLWVAPDDVSYATIEFGDHVENHRIRGRGFRKWLTRTLSRANGKPLTRNSIDQVVDELDAEAQLGPVLQPAIRVAEYEGAIYLDIGDDKWRAIRIDASGFGIDGRPPVKFLRNPGMLPLPVPVPGEIGELRSFINIASDNDFKLYVGALVGALVPGSPHVILMISGEQGSAKTTACNIFRSFVDPNIASVRSIPATERDLFISANNVWLLVFDNVSYIKSEISDALCRISSGGSFVTRRLYADDEEMLLSVRRPVLANGIPKLSERPDLLDRAILLTLPSINAERRLSESQFKKDFEAAAPCIMGALCAAISSVLRNRQKVELETAPRMADFTRIVTAAEEGLGWEPGSFLAAYQENLEAAMSDLAAQSPVVQAVSMALDKRDDEIKEPATQLLQTLTSCITEQQARDRGWPKQPNQLARALGRLAPVMRAMSIEVELDFERDKATNVKYIRISRPRSQF